MPGSAWSAAGKIEEDREDGGEERGRRTHRDDGSDTGRRCYVKPEDTRTAAGHGEEV